MKHLIIFLCLVFFVVLFTACGKKNYEITSVSASRIELDSSWNNRIRPEIVELVEKYKTALSNELDIVIGEAAQNLTYGLPQSLLSNLTADVFKSTADRYLDTAKVDFAVINVNSHRSPIHAGTITIRAMYETYPFEDELVILDVPGNAVHRLFQYYAFNGGEGLSSDVRLVIKQRDIHSILINGQELDFQKTYRIATFDYLAEGNDGMSALREFVHYETTGMFLRDIMIDYVKRCTAEGLSVDSRLDDRIIIE